MLIKILRTVGCVAGLLWGGTVMAGETMDAREKAIADIAYYAASGDQIHLADVLNQGLDGSLGVNEVKEVLIQLYAYCGFPRSLNALNTLVNYPPPKGSGLVTAQS